MGYKNVCLNCQISLSEGTNYELFNTNKTCPICKGKKYFVNEKFKALKKSNDKAWKIIEYLLLSGYDFINPIYGVERYMYYEFPKNLKEAEAFIRKMRSLGESRKSSMAQQSLDFTFWNEQWKQGYYDREKGVRANPLIEYWDKRANDFSFIRKSNDYDFGRKVYAALIGVLTADSIMLDIGAGPGSFTIPFAQHIKAVTAIEPFKGMVEVLKEMPKRLVQVISILLKS